MEGCEAPFEVTNVMERPVRTGGGGDSTPSTKHGVLSEQEPRESDTDEERQERSVDEARGKAALNFRGWKQVVKEGKTTWTAEWGGDWDSVALWWGWSDDDQEGLESEWAFLGQAYLRRKLSVGRLETALSEQGVLKRTQGSRVDKKDAHTWTQRHKIMDGVLCMEHRIARLQMAAHQWQQQQQQQQGQKKVATRDYFSQTTTTTIVEKTRCAASAGADAQSASAQCGGALAGVNRAGCEQRSGDNLVRAEMQTSCAVLVQCGSGAQDMGTQTGVKRAGGKQRSQRKTAKAKQALLQSKWATLARFRLEKAEEVEGTVRKRVWEAVLRIKRRHAAARRVQAAMQATIDRAAWSMTDEGLGSDWYRACFKLEVAMLQLKGKNYRMKTRKQKVWRDPTDGVLREPG